MEDDDDLEEDSWSVSCWKWGYVVLWPTVSESSSQSKWLILQWLKLKLRQIVNIFHLIWQTLLWTSVKCLKQAIFDRYDLLQNTGITNNHGEEYCSLICQAMANEIIGFLKIPLEKNRFQLHCELNDRVLSIGEEVTVLSINLFQAHLFCYN